MQTNGPIAWDALLRAVRTQYPDLYRSWFDDLPTGRVESGELRVRVDDPARARYLRDHCTRAFVDACMAMSGHLLSARFVCPREEQAAFDGGTESAYLQPLPLNPDHTFEQFVVGPSNRLAHAACRAVCNQPGALYNPLFIHGPSGLGKTHLLQAICAAMRRNNPPLDVNYVSCETFVNDFIRAMEAGQLQAFRDTARRFDALIIDDVQFLAKRESSQEELFHTFNVLYQSRRQIILSADSPPSEIPNLEDRLVSRFNWGLVAQIDPPNRETRQAILQKKARLRGCEVPENVLDFVAERVQSNVRTLEGALTKLIMESQLAEQPLTVEMARKVLDGYNGQKSRSVQISAILEVVAEHYGLRLQELLGRKRSRSITYPRQIGMYLARKLTALSLDEIGDHFGRDHSTVLHAERTIEAEREIDPAIEETISTLARRLLARPC